MLIKAAKYLLIVVAALLILRGTASLHAASIAHLQLVSASTQDFTCTGGMVEYSFDVTAGAVDANLGGTDVDYFGIIMFDGNGVPLEAFNGYLVPAGQTLADSAMFAFGVANGAMNDITARPVTIQFYDTGDLSNIPGALEPDIYNAIKSTGTLLTQTQYDPAVFIQDCSNLPLISPASSGGEIVPAFPPPRPGIDTHWANVLIVPVLDDPDHSGFGLVFWGMDSEGQGYLAFVVSSAALADLPDHPAEAVVIAATDDGLYTFYKLSTGEYQLNIGPDPEGKVQVVIFDGIPPTNVYRRDFNVYDILNPADQG